jgi:hypothetical protein
LLDIHNTTSFYNSVKFLISEYKDFWKYFDIKYIISWFDNLHPWWSDSYMNSIWKKWFCLECWSINFWDKKESEKLAEKSIINFLKLTWNINWKVEIFNNQKFIKFDYIYKNKTLNFKFKKNFKDFEKIEAWEIIAYDWEEKIKAKENSYILFSYKPSKIWDECFCLGK